MKTKVNKRYFIYSLKGFKFYLNILAYIKNGEIIINIYNFHYYKGAQIFQLNREYIFKYAKKSYKYYILKALKNINLKDANKLKSLGIIPVWLG